VELVSQGTLKRLTRAKKLIMDERQGKYPSNKPN